MANLQPTGDEAVTVLNHSAAAARRQTQDSAPASIWFEYGPALQPSTLRTPASRPGLFAGKAAAGTKTRGTPLTSFSWHATFLSGGEPSELVSALRDVASSLQVYAGPTRVRLALEFARAGQLPK